MSAAVKSEDDTMQCCASCGIAGGDDIKLKKCDDCDLIKYCSVKCQREHKSHHEEACKKRAAEIQDEILFKQPESSYYEDCPICCLPLSIDPKKSILFSCCSKYMCGGCVVANMKREIEGKLQEKCPFCRKAMPYTDEVINERWMKRIEANDPVSMYQMGTDKYEEGNYTAAFEYWTRAAALGDVQAHYQLSILYLNGQGVEKDEKKELHHMEKATIGGSPNARHNLGCLERGKGRVGRAVKHFIIAAKLGYDMSLEAVKDLYKDGYVSREDVVAAFRGYQAAIDAMKSPQREEAAKYFADKFG
mmetsp:Transcript_17268/g.28373  ORF Transcript_17268/g.28373 Transcript_17268/m.28373 type:complete len:304 (+) Transcript_17268:191-1102(+)